MIAYQNEQLTLSQMETGQIGTVVGVLGGRGLRDCRKTSVQSRK
jgi:hypothetical protein